MPTTFTIPAGNLFMNATIYTGTGAAATITNGAAGQAFQPDLVWLKCRSNTTNHYLTDSVRGTTSQLYSNSTALQGSSGNVLTAFNSNGFSLGTDAEINGSVRTYVGWQWKAGGTATTITVGSVSPGVPSIASSASANTTSGFSVVTYTTPASGSFTVGHGLGVAPSFIISRIRTIVNNWYCYHVSLGNASEVILNSTANSSATSDWNNTSPTSSVFSMGSGWSGSYSMVSYCWSEIAGFSKFGSYTGNGVVDGPFVYTGFRPRFIMWKSTGVSANGWIMYDTSRNPYNLTTASLFADLDTAENATSLATENTVDILSNGFKMRTANYANNGPSVPYIYIAFAENPFKYANAR